jgi:phage terminase large subunit GpA-like protein
VFEDALQVLVSAYSAAMQPPPHLRVDEWAEQNLVLSERNSPIPGRLNLSMTPYMRFPLQLFTDPGIERIGGALATQVGKTTMIFCMLGYIIDFDPGPTMVLYPTQDTAKAVSKDRIQPLIQDCPSLARHLTGIEDDLQLLSYTFDRLTVRFAWAQGQSTIRSHPIRYLFKDESSAVFSGAWSEADNRTKAYYNRRIVEFSTPRTETDSVWSYLGLKLREGAEANSYCSADWIPGSSTSVYWYEMPCRSCGKFFRFEFSGLRWPEDCAIRELDDKGRYECPHCRYQHTDSDKPALLSSGEWRSPNTGGRWVGLHMNSLYGPWDTCRFGAVAAQYLRAKLRRDPEVMAAVVNNYFALPFSFEQAGATLVSQTALDATHTASGYKRNQVPEAVRAITLGADVRGTEIHYVVDGWGAAGESWRISWGILEDLPHLEDFVKSSTWDHPTAGKIRIAVAGIDSRYRRHDVVELCRRFQILKAVQGEQRIQEPTSSGQLPWKTTMLDRDSKGKPVVGSLVGYRVNTLYWKEYIYSRINEPERDQVAGTWHMPEDTDEVFDRHMRSEQEVMRRKRGSGELVRLWVLRKGYEANHYLDAQVYSCAIAHAFKLFRLTAESPVIGAAAAAAPARTAQAAAAGAGGDRRAPWVDPNRMRLRKT